MPEHLQVRRENYYYVTKVTLNDTGEPIKEEKIVSMRFGQKEAREMADRLNADPAKPKNILYK